MSRYVVSELCGCCVLPLLGPASRPVTAGVVTTSGSLSDPELVVLREEGEATPEVVEEEAAPVEVETVEDVVDFLLPDRLTLVVSPLKQRDNSAAALFVKLTSADIPAPVEPVALFHAARQTTRKQARI